MAHEDREADLAQGLAQLAGEGLPIGGVAVQEAPEVAGADPELLVESLALRGLGQVVGLRLAHLVVADVVAVRRLGALPAAVAHASPPAEA